MTATKFPERIEHITSESYEVRMEAIRRWNAFPALLAACEKAANDLDDFELWCSNNVKKVDSDHYCGKARAQLDDLLTSARASIKATRQAIALAKEQP